MSTEGKRELQRLWGVAEKLGWRVELRGSDHIAWWPPGKKVVYTAKTPSPAGFKKDRAKLARAGLPVGPTPHKKKDKVEIDKATIEAAITHVEGMILIDGKLPTTSHARVSCTDHVDSIFGGMSGQGFYQRVMRPVKRQLEAQEKPRRDDGYTSAEPVPEREPTPFTGPPERDDLDLGEMAEGLEAAGFRPLDKLTKEILDRVGYRPPPFRPPGPDPRDVRRIVMQVLKSYEDMGTSVEKILNIIDDLDSGIESIFNLFAGKEA